MKQTIQLRIGQHLTMTPQLQQAIRLLQLSTLDLQNEIQEALDSNPMLEMNEDGSAEGLSSDSDWDGETDSGVNGQEKEISDKTSTLDQINVDSGTGTKKEKMDSDEPSQMDDIPDELPVDSSWEDTFDNVIPQSSAPAQESHSFENQDNSSETLREHLLWQMRLTPFSNKDLEIAMNIIDAIDEQGYLTTSCEEILESLDEDLEIELDEVEAVLHRIHNFDPVGVGARDIRESLIIQLQHLSNDTPWLQTAKVLVNDHLQLLANREFNQLMRRMKLSQSDLQQVVTLIQTLNPRPGSVIASKQAEYVVPDVVVKKVEGKWKVELNSEAIPKIRINSDYAGLVKRADNSSDNTYLKNHLQEARWFIKSLKSRNDTLLKVATCIVERQRGFLEHGEEAMKALVLHDVAKEVEMHESTISRVTTQKYMHTPRGIFELKYFFSSHVGTASGGECSATAIRAFIKKLVAAEDPRKPLSDSKIAQLLAGEGINVARRTIAKYRESISIPSSSERKRLM
ncbi:MAG: RNA polymerase factor sigma-54 [Gammaproteobacteria bacterium]